MYKYIQINQQPMTNLLKKIEESILSTLFSFKYLPGWF